MRTCENCSNCLLVAYGYSNWTVEGTTVYCKVKKQEPFDRWYGEDKRLSFAEKCNRYKKGNPEYCDVEQENFGSLSGRAKRIVRSK